MPCQSFLAPFNKCNNLNFKLLSQSGLGIGEDLTRAVARLVMLDWDKNFIALAEESKLTTLHVQKIC